nr:hypothetical protein [Sphingomonas sp.]
MMSASESAQFRLLFIEFKRLYCKDARDLALFVRRPPATRHEQIYITGPKIELVERVSPGGWRDSGAPSGADVALVVGTPECWPDLGTAKPSTEGG